jgi:hypothetical protein
MQCDRLELPPSPVQEIVKVLLPALEIVTVSEPEVAFVPVHEPDAVQEVALVEAQEISTLPPSNTELELDVKEDIAAAIA